MDGRPNRRNKVAYSNFSVMTWAGSKALRSYPNYMCDHLAERTTLLRLLEPFCFLSCASEQN